MKTVKLVSPWIDYYEEINALFGQDPDVNVVYDEDAQEIKLYVTGQDKAYALDKLMPAEKTFGNVVVKVTIIPANETVEKTNLDLLKDAFMGNPAFSYAVAANKGFFDMSYVVFKNAVVQYHNDDLGDVNGMRSTLYQEIAKDVLGMFDGIYYCTDTPRNLGVPQKAEA